MYQRRAPHQRYLSRLRTKSTRKNMILRDWFSAVWPLLGSSAIKVFLGAIRSAMSLLFWSYGHQRLLEPEALQLTDRFVALSGLPMWAMGWGCKTNLGKTWSAIGGSRSQIVVVDTSLWLMNSHLFFVKGRSLCCRVVGLCLWSSIAFFRSSSPFTRGLFPTRYCYACGNEFDCSL